MKDATLRRFEELEARIAAVQQRVDEQATEKTRDREWLRSLSTVPSMVLGPGLVTYTAPDLADTAKVGDPDPTAASDKSLCGVQFERAEAAWPWTCTREPNHRGQHVAGDTKVVRHVWPNDRDADPLPDGGTHTCPRCLAYVEALPPRRICDECETEVDGRDVTRPDPTRTHGPGPRSRTTTAPLSRRRARREP